MHRCAAIFLLLGLFVTSSEIVLAQEDAPAADGAETSISFRAQIAPILIAKCVGCHGSQDPQGGFQLHTFELLMADGYVEPGSAEDSHLYGLLVEEDPEARMPKDDDPLAADEVTLIAQWIKAGATFDGDDANAILASIVPRQPFAPPPEAYRAAVPITSLAFSPDGELLAASGYHEVTLWKTADGSLVRRIHDIAERVYGLAWSPDGQLLAVASGTPGAVGDVRLVNPHDGSLVRLLATLEDVALDVAFSPDGSRLAAAGADRAVRVFEVASGAEQLLIEDHADWVLGVAWNPDATRLATASRDKTSKVFDAASGDSLLTYPGHGEIVYDVAFNQDGSEVLTCGRDRKIHRWNPADGKKTAEIAGFGLDVLRVQFVEGAVFACSGDGTLRVQRKVGEEVKFQQLAGLTDWAYSLDVHAPSKRLAGGTFDGQVSIINSDDGSVLVAFRAAPGMEPSADDQAAN